MKKIFWLVVVLCLILLPSCQSAGERDTGGDSLIAFEQIEGDLETGFTVKGIPWGISFEEVKELFPEGEFTGQGGRVLMGPVPIEEDLSFYRVFVFMDDSSQSLCSVEFLYRSQSEETHKSIVETLYAAAKEHMPDDARGLSLSELDPFSTNYWDPADGSTVIWSSPIAAQPGEFITMVQMYMPREIPNSLA